LVIGGCISRPVRFVMYHKYFEIPVLRYLFKAAGVIPIASSKEDPEVLERALQRIDQLLARGEVVCVFPEGQITRTGELNSFRPGIERITQQRPVAIVPMALTGLWGTFFSRTAGGILRWLPKPLWHQVTLRIGASLPTEPADRLVLEKLTASLINSSVRSD